MHTPVWWLRYTSRRTERDAARDKDAPVAQADAAVSHAVAAVPELTQDAAPLVADRGAASVLTDTTPETLQDPPGASGPMTGSYDKFATTLLS